MSDHPSVIIKESFKDLEDPRVEYLCDHKLFDIIVLTICAVICGADHWTEVEAYGQMKEKWLRTFLELPHGIPSHDTIGGLLYARIGRVPETGETIEIENIRLTIQEIKGQRIHTVHCLILTPAKDETEE